MQGPSAVMAGGFVEVTHRLIVGVHQDQPLRLGRNNLGFRGGVWQDLAQRIHLVVLARGVYRKS